MSDAAIKAALDAACRWMHDNCGEAESVEAWRYDAAGTVAAFLRALDDGAVLKLLSAEEDKNAGWRRARGGRRGMSETAYARWKRHATDQEAAELKRLDANLSRLYGEVRKAAKLRAILWNRVTKRRAYREKANG